MFMDEAVTADARMIGIVIVDSAGNGVGISSYTDGNAYFCTIGAGGTNWIYQAALQTLAGAGQPSTGGGRGITLWFRLKKTGTTYDAWLSASGRAWDFHSLGTTTNAFTVAYMGWGILFPNTALNGRVFCEWVNKV